MNTHALSALVRKSAVRAAKIGSRNSLIWQYLAREWTADDLLVLTYHRVGDPRSGAPITADQLAEQIEWMSGKVDFVSGGEMAAILSGRHEHRRPMVLLTFDDGHRCLYENVYPVLRRYGVPAVGFLATGPISEAGYLWTDDVRMRIEDALPGRIELPVLGSLELADRAGRLLQGRHIVQELKGVTDPDRLNVLTAIRAELPCSRRTPAMISWDQAREMSGTFCWGAHTHTHPILSRVAPSVARAEIRESRRLITAHTGQDVSLFAYPNGSRDDFTPEVKEILKEEGFLAAFTTVPGVVTATDDAFALNRCPTTAASVEDFAWMTARPSRLS